MTPSIAAQGIVQPSEGQDERRPPPIKRWAAKCKAAVVMDIFKGKNTAAEVARQYDLTVSEIEGWIDEAQRCQHRLELSTFYRSKMSDLAQQQWTPR
ncbi:DUF1153 domain-containing protein [Halomonas koreensis]|uniref:DUF1153 domain-containing protein n=1 Tax=Halomonas koreensis TaxID=245385 RepID=UPI0035B54D4B